MTEPIPTDEIDQLLWFTTKVTELTQAGVQDVVPKTAPLLPEYQRNRVLRDLELSMNRELKTLTETEQKAVETQMDSLKNEFVVFEFMDEDCDHIETYKLFANETKATEALFKLIERQNMFLGNDKSYKPPYSLELCLQMVQGNKSICYRDGPNYYQDIKIKHIKTELLAQYIATGS